MSKNPRLEAARSRHRPTALDGFCRYAVYFAPRPARALGRFGAAWFGWNAERARDCAALQLEGLPRPREELVAAPRRYGFHGTLKAPFRIAEGATAAALDRAVAALAAKFAPFSIPLGLRALDRFLALTLVAPAPQLGALEAACVTRLDRFRAPLDPAEVARRETAGLTERQVGLLSRWGYPYVLGEFRFHLTLTGPLAGEDLNAARAALGAALAPVLAEPAEFEDLCLFGEAADGRFRVVSRHALGAAARP